MVIPRGRGEERSEGSMSRPVVYTVGTSLWRDGVEIRVWLVLGYCSLWVKLLEMVLYHRW
jgi:hypothetical protein